MRRIPQRFKQKLIALLPEVAEEKDPKEAEDVYIYNLFQKFLQEGRKFTTGINGDEEVEIVFEMPESLILVSHAVERQGYSYTYMATGGKATFTFEWTHSLTEAEKAWFSEIDLWHSIDCKEADIHNMKRTLAGLNEEEKEHLKTIKSLQKKLEELED